MVDHLDESSARIWLVFAGIALQEPKILVRDAVPLARQISRQVAWPQQRDGGGLGLIRAKAAQAAVAQLAKELPDHHLGSTLEYMEKMDYFFYVNEHVSTEVFRWRPRYVYHGNGSVVDVAEWSGCHMPDVNRLIKSSRQPEAVDRLMVRLELPSNTVYFRKVVQYMADCPEVMKV